MFTSTLKRLAQSTRLPVRKNPFKTQKEWPPDFSKLDPKYQFRLERRYRRRTKLKYQPVKWVKGVKLAATSSSFIILVYGVFFMEMGDMGGQGVNPFEWIRKWVREQASSIWTLSSPTVRRTAQENDPPPKPPS